MEFTRPDDSWDDFVKRTEERKNERYRSFVNALTSWLNSRPTSEEKGAWRVRMEGGGETYPMTVFFFISDQGATNHLTTTRTVLEHLQHLQITPSCAKQQALKDSWGSLPAGGTANS